MHDKIEKFFRILKETKEPAYDVETNGLDWKHCHVVGYSVSDGKEAVYVPVRHSAGGNIENIASFEHGVANHITNHTGTVVGHNVKFDMHFSENHNIILRKVADTMVREALIDENQRSYSLENVCQRHNIAPKLGKELYNHIAQKTGCKPDRSAMGHYFRLRGDDPIAVEYAERDTLTTKQLYDAQEKILYAQNLDVVSNLENELTVVLQNMERRGVLLDPAEIDSVKKKVDQMQADADLHTSIVDEDGFPVPINTRSGKQLKEYFEWCEIDDWPTTLPTSRHINGQPSFTKDYLAGTSEGMKILNARKIQHLKSSFIDVLDNFLYRNRIHTTFNQTVGETHGTRTGRLSSSWPNMQQVPKRDRELGSIYRRMFVARDEFTLVEFDYSQAEPRLFTHYSAEPILLRGYRAEPCIDMHNIAVEYMGEPLKRIAEIANSTPRDVAKNLNLGIMYTMGPGKLSAKLGISYDDAIEILNKWQRTFPRVSSYSKTNPGFTQRAASVAEQRGYVKTILGRRARFDNPRFAYRAANRIVQGGSADILKWKLVEVDRYIRDNKLEDVCRMLLTIHDSILFEIHKTRLDIVDQIKAILERVQTPPFNLTVPFVAEYKTGANWAEATYG